MRAPIRIPPSTILQPGAVEWLDHVAEWGPERLAVILAAPGGDVYGLLSSYIEALRDKAERAGVSRVLAGQLSRLEDLRSLARLAHPSRGPRPSPVSDIACEGLRRRGMVEWVWGLPMGGSDGGAR